MKTSRNLLLNLCHTQIILSTVIREGSNGGCHEPQGIILNCKKNVTGQGGSSLIFFTKKIKKYLTYFRSKIHYFIEQSHNSNRALYTSLIPPTLSVFSSVNVALHARKIFSSYRAFCFVFLPKKTHGILYCYRG